MTFNAGSVNVNNGPPVPNLEPPGVVGVVGVDGVFGDCGNEL